VIYLGSLDLDLTGENGSGGGSPWELGFALPAVSFGSGIGRRGSSGGPGGQRRGVRRAEGHVEVDGVVEVVGDVLQRRRDAAGGAPCGGDLRVVISGIGSVRNRTRGG
jgi:hypothetical protein